MKQLVPMLLSLLLLAGCSENTSFGASYRQITQDEAKEMMDKQHSA